ncbi:hypothetical protein Tco_1549412 [Tanacetum coccineum]
MNKRPRSTRGQSSASQEVSAEEKVRRLGVFENNTHQLRYDTLERRPIHPGDVIDWEFFANQGLARSFLNSINTDPFLGPQWMNLFQINESVYRELGGEQREMSLLEFGWRVGLYTEQQSRDRATLSGLSRAETGGKKAPIESLKLISTISIASTPMRLFATSPIGLLSEIMSALSVEPPPHVFKEKSLITRACSWNFKMEYVFGPNHEWWRKKKKKSRKRLEVTRVMKGLEAPLTCTVIFDEKKLGSS